MIERIIDILNAATGLPVVKAYGVARLMPGPHVRTQAGEYTPIAVDDNAPWSYWRVLSHNVADANTFAACTGERHTLVLRLVALLNDDCDVTDAMRDAVQGVGSASGAMATALGALIVQVPRAALSLDGVTEGIGTVPLQRRLVAADITMEITADAGCLAGCDPGDVLCALIGAASNDAVKACLGAGRINEMCEGGGPCPETTVNGVASDVPDIHVQQGGVDVGTLNPATGIHTVPVCPPAGDGSAILKDTGGATLSTTPVPPATSVNITAPDALVQLKDSAGSNIGSINHYRSGSLANIVTAPDGQVQPRDSGGTAIGAPVTVRSAGTSDATIPDASVQIKDSAGTDIGSPWPVLAADSVDLFVPDSTITLPDGQTKSVKATQPYTVPLTAPLKFSFSPYDQGSDLWTVTADEAGNYNAYTQDGGSGTITYSKNGGAFVALSGTITLAVGDTIQVNRTTITAAGWSRWQRQVTP